MDEKLKTDAFKKLTKTGKVVEWGGLVTRFNLKKVSDKAFLWGLKGQELWSKEALELVIAPYREYALRQKLPEKTIDEDLDYFAKKTGVDLNRARRVFYQIDIEPEEKPKKLVEEAEEELSEFDEEEGEEE
jgi:hypothetical protein